MKRTKCLTCGRYEKRSSEQNRRLWALYTAMSNKLRPGGNTYSPEQFHLYCKIKLLGATDHKLPNGQVLTMPNSTADLDIPEFADYMAQVEAIAAEHGVYLDE